MRPVTFLRVIVAVAGAALFVVPAAAGEPVTRDKVIAALPALPQLAERLIGEDGVPGLSIAVVYRARAGGAARTPWA